MSQKSLLGWVFLAFEPKASDDLPVLALEERLHRAMAADETRLAGTDTSPLKANLAIACGRAEIRL